MVISEVLVVRRGSVGEADTKDEWEAQGRTPYLGVINRLSQGPALFGSPLAGMLVVGKPPTS